MMQNKKLLRVLVVVVAAAILLVPGFVMAYAWGGTLNMEVSIAAVAITLIVAAWLPSLRWISAVAAALVIAVPPYPYWSSWDETRGQYLHLFHGYNLENTPITTFAIIFSMAMLLFAVIFWAIRGWPAAKLGSGRLRRMR